ncbi:MAG: helix-turn-helix transcriptional regulator [Muribaculaceae bacterium]|nr:helix-turn-helix transcriptional regulator [Muribaculaceae bacterium]
MSNVKERLQQFLKSERISASEFSRQMGLSPAYLASMRKSMPEEKIERLIQIYPQLNRDWLLYGEGEMYRDLGRKDVDPYKLHRHMVPLIPLAAHAGKFEDYVTGVSADECQKIYSPFSGVDLSIRVHGNSMEPKIHDGVYLFVKRINDKAFIPWGTPLVLDTENGSMVKILYPSEKSDEYLEARSYNKDYPPFLVPKESIYGIYRIIAMMDQSVSF